MVMKPRWLKWCPGNVIVIHIWVFRIFRHLSNQSINTLRRRTLHFIFVLVVSRSGELGSGGHGSGSGDPGSIPISTNALRFAVCGGCSGYLSSATETGLFDFVAAVAFEEPVEEGDGPCYCDTDTADLVGRQSQAEMLVSYQRFRRE